MLHINNKDYSEERKNSQPLSFEEQNEVADLLNAMAVNFRINKEGKELLQRMLYDYQNKTDFFTIQGGWDGVNRLRDKANAYDELMKQNK